MNKQDISLTELRTRLEAEFETPDGRTVALCRDATGSYWIVDESERVMSLHEFAGHCHSAARVLRSKQFRGSLGRIATRARDWFAHVVNRPQPTAARAAHG